MTVKREDKSGRRIYSNALWEKLLATGQRLMELGYKESMRKPNLFYSVRENGSFFADLRGTELVPLWDDSRPLFYWNFSKSLPPWKCRRLIKEELTRLGTNDCAARLSFEFADDPIFENTSAYVDDSGLVFDWNDGYCRQCGKDFQAEGEFCSQECREKFRETLKATCAVCGEKIDLFKEVVHHVRYSPREIVPVHRGCHTRIHKTDLFPHLMPKDDPGNRYKKRSPERKSNYVIKRGTVICTRCRSEFATVSDFESHWKARHVRGRK